MGIGSLLSSDRSDYGIVETGSVFAGDLNAILEPDLDSGVIGRVLRFFQMLNIS